jgi:hypothetical protein
MTPSDDTGLPAVTPSLLAEGVIHDQRPNTVTDAEVLSVTDGVDEATAQPVVVLTLRSITDSGWRSVNYSLHPDNARSLLDRLTGVVVEMERV